jgi:hypothetical protein
MTNTSFLVITVLVILLAALSGLALHAGLTLWQEGRKREPYKPGSKEAEREGTLEVWRKGGV